jgi:hypothetical protein
MEPAAYFENVTWTRDGWMLDWFKAILNLTPREQLVEIEKREPSLEERVERLLGRLGTYSKRTANELDEIMADLEKVLDIVEKIISVMENIGGADRARNLRRRLRNHRTRAQNAYQNLREAGSERAAG